MKTEIFEKAQGILQYRRNKAKSENEMRIEEINSKIPQIKEINDVIFNTGKELIKIISEGKGTDISKKIDQLKQYNIGAQAMARKILVQHGYPADYLDIHYTCPMCNDMGYVNNSFCECFNKLCGKLSTDELNKSVRINLSSFDSFNLNYYQGNDYLTMEKIFLHTKKYAEEFTPDSKSILMFGDTGLGKTHLSLAIANKVLEKGYSVIYDSTINILRSIEREHFGREHSSEMIDLVMDSELLILDDLGTEYKTDFNSSTIYNIINSRLNTGRATIISTNLDFAGMRSHYESRVVSRITSFYTCLEFKGEDVRFQIKQKDMNKLP